MARTVSPILVAVLSTAACSPVRTPVDLARRGTGPVYYVLFTQNVHDWTNPEESLITVERVLDLHEERGIPVDFYFTDPMVQLLRGRAPSLLDRLRLSPVTAVSYHLRPPHPAYVDFDWLGLDPMADDLKYDVLLEYEEHRLDLETGRTGWEAGGYQLLADLLGHPPVAVGIGSLKETLARIYAGKWATFGISHETTYDLGEEESGLALRPEHLPILLYEHVLDDPCDVLHHGLQDTFASDTGSPGNPPWFVNVKMHDNDYYALTAGWKPIYYDEDDQMRFPPWDLARADRTLKGPESSAVQWDHYIGMLDCVAASPDLLVPVNLHTVTQMLEECREAGTC